MGIESNHSVTKELNVTVSSLDAMLILLRMESLWLMIFSETISETIKSGGGSRLRVCS